MKMNEHYVEGFYYSNGMINIKESIIKLLKEESK